MSEAYVGEIRMFAGNYPPRNWAFCHGQLLPISEYETLFVLVGTTYGGDGVTTFGVPDLRGRIPVHQASGYPLGRKSGVESVTLLERNLPSHSHGLRAAATAATSTSAQGNMLASWADAPYGAPGPGTALSVAGVEPVGGTQAHENRPPSLALSFILCLYGIFPSQS
ncbi:phage tail protein [Kitasatospora indigofera]|uniref:phage tail protein n=1 Tax=Kitasatospora indigofera TaxID=67307 RepID=UPI0036ACB10A